MLKKARAQFAYSQVSSSSRSPVKVRNVSLTAQTTLQNSVLQEEDMY
jgi:hypothetical protein